MGGGELVDHQDELTAEVRKLDDVMAHDYSKPEYMENQQRMAQIITEIETLMV